MIRKHNLESDMGIHSYTLGINQFGDMVNIINYFSSFYFLFLYLKTNEEFRKQMNGYKINLKSQSDQMDRHTFFAPSNVVLPDSVGKLLTLSLF